MNSPVPANCTSYTMDIGRPCGRSPQRTARPGLARREAPHPEVGEARGQRAHRGMGKFPRRGQLYRAGARAGPGISCKLDEHRERRLLVGGLLRRRADAGELLRVIDGGTSFSRRGANLA